jgi:hypothetical protein
MNVLAIIIVFTSLNLYQMHSNFVNDNTILKGLLENQLKSKFYRDHNMWDY